MFQTPIDIANRTCQHIGARQIDVNLGFTEISVQAFEIGACYDKLRRAELQRNTWAFATKVAVLRPVDVTTRKLSPSLWGANTAYFVGSIVADQFGIPWISKIPSNAGNDPLNSVGCWEQYFGPLTVSLYDTTGSTSYWAGELVYTTAGDGTYRAYISLISGNTDVPAAATAWSATTTYIKNQAATFNSIAYMSLIDFNINQEPDLSAVNWAIGTTYASGAKVNGSNGFTYTSLVNGNVGNDPTTDAGTNWQSAGMMTPWTSVFTGGSGSLNWLEIGGAEFPNGVALAPLAGITIYPIGAGPQSQASTKNIFKLPANYLRTAPQDPKVGSNSLLGAPTNLSYKDWLYQSGYIVSRDSTPIRLRFIADVADVASMDDMFCEGLAARIGFETCERITQSTEKLKNCIAEYEKSMGDARTIDAIENGAEEPPLDDWIACRL